MENSGIGSTRLHALSDRMHCRGSTQNGHHIYPDTRVPKEEQCYSSNYGALPMLAIVMKLCGNTSKRDP